MSLLGNFVFKPKSLEISKKVIEGFTNEWLEWNDIGVYIEYTDYRVPKGYINLEIHSEDCNLERFTECCYLDEPVTSADLTSHMMVVLDHDGFFEAHHINDCYSKEQAEEDERIVGFGTDNPKYYSFEDRELSEIIACLQENNSRSLSFWNTNVYITEKDESGMTKSKSMPLIEYALNVSLEDNKTKKAA